MKPSLFEMLKSRGIHLNPGQIVHFVSPKNYQEYSLGKRIEKYIRRMENELTQGVQYDFVEIPSPCAELCDKVVARRFNLGSIGKYHLLMGDLTDIVSFIKVLSDVSSIDDRPIVDLSQTFSRHMDFGVDFGSSNMSMLASDRMEEEHNFFLDQDLMCNSILPHWDEKDEDLDDLNQEECVGDDILYQENVTYAHTTQRRDKTEDEWEKKDDVKDANFESDDVKDPRTPAQDKKMARLGNFESKGRPNLRAKKSRICKESEKLMASNNVHRSIHPIEFRPSPIPPSGKCSGMLETQAKGELSTSPLESEDQKDAVDVEVLEKAKAELVQRLTAVIVDYVNTTRQMPPMEEINEILKGKIVLKPSGLSRLVINERLKIFLPEYNELEVSFRPLPLTIYILFLLHLEGIVLNYIGDYERELEEIYSIVMPGRDDKSARRSLASLTDTLSGSLNQKIAIIKRTFKANILNEEMAQKYYITGSRGHEYKISLPRELIQLPAIFNKLSH